MIYLDYAATTPISEEALETYIEVSKRFYGNTSSLHDIGSSANELLKVARRQWATMLGGSEEGVFFTSGGTEANQLAILTLVNAYRNQGMHLITTEVEHSSNYYLFKKLEESFEVSYLPLNEYGQIDLEDLKRAIRPSTILASIQTANGETGFIQPIQQIGQLLKEHQIIFHTDFVQAFGHVPVKLEEYQIDALSISSHKIYGPKGTGLAYINPGIAWESYIPGTTHENGFRPGTVDLPAIMAFTVAGQARLKEAKEEQGFMMELRQYFKGNLDKEVSHYSIYESERGQLPQIIALSIAELQGQYIMLKCNENGIAISTGSACQAGSQTPSRTIRSLGKSRDEANQLVRVSFGKDTTKSELDHFIHTLAAIVKEVER